MKTLFYSKIAQLLQAVANCEACDDNRPHWEDMADMHADRIEALCKQYLPHGSGFDSGCKLSDDSTPQRLIFSADFHHMDDNGFYCGWSTHTVIVTACLQFGFALRVTGRDMRGIKEYIADTFHNIGSQAIEG